MYNIDQLKHYIKDNLLTSSGAINSAIIRRDAFIKSDIAKCILYHTSSLDICQPSLGERIKAILINYNNVKLCPSCNKPVKLFHLTCGDKNCINTSISNNKKFSIDILKDNNDIDNEVKYNELSDTLKCELRIYVTSFIKENLLKRNGHLNIDRINKLEVENVELFKNVCILTYFCKNYEQFNLSSRIKLILLNARCIEYCSCGKPKALSGEKNKMFLPTCGSKECVYKVVSNKTIENYEYINAIKTKNRLEKDKILKQRFDEFITNMSNFEHIEYDKFRQQIIDLYKNSHNNYNILGSNLSYYQFFNNSEIIKNLIYHTRYIEPDIKCLHISQRVYNIVNNILEVPRCKNCNSIDCTFVSLSLGYSTYCNNCKYTESVSNSETSLFNYISSLDVNIIQSNRSIIPPQELDIVIPSKKIAIEFNGNYWHSEYNGKDKNYHLNKTKLYEEQGYRLIHIFEDEWINKPDIVKSRIKNILGLTKRKIYARKCIIKEISNDIKSKFLEKYHIQGDDNSSIKLGLFYKNRLIAIMTFGKRRFDKKEGFELIRYATIANFNIVGGAGKLLKYFIRKYNNPKIISYADRRWSQGNLYKTLGFKLIRYSEPNYFYIKSDNSLNRLSRINFQKHKLQQKLNIFDSNLSEIENMKNNGYTRIFDCGNYVFEIN